MNKFKFVPIVLLLLALIGTAAFAEEQKTDVTMQSIQESIDTLSKKSWFSQIFAPIVSLLAVLVSGFAVWTSYRISTRTLQEKTKEENRKSIREKLDGFYGPMQQYRGISKSLYKIFMDRRTPEEKEKYPGKSGHYSMLMALLDGHEFEGVDKKLVEQIASIGKASEELIHKEIGMVDDPLLQDKLWQVATHYSIIDLASKGELVGGGEEFLEFTFPRELDDELQRKSKELNDEFAKLQKVG